MTYSTLRAILIAQVACVSNVPRMQALLRISRRPSLVRTISLLFTILVLVCLDTFADQGARDSVFVVGLDGLHYFVNWKQISSQPGWLAGQQPFPFRLGQEARRAESYLVERDQLTNHLDLDEVRIHRLLLPAQLVQAHQSNGEVSTNQWFVALTILVQPHGPTKHIVMMMDGLYAAEKQRSSYDQSIELSSPLRPLIEQPVDSVTPNRTESQARVALRPHPYEQINSATFAIPGVQWDPSVEEFPLDLSAQVNRAKKYLLADASVAEEALNLTEVYLKSYMPVEAVRANHLEFSHNRHHWLVVFRFSLNTSDLHRGYTVYMLLDGTMLQAREETGFP
jgi:hypothetical protein